jgi:hypothetical protein
VDPIEMKKYELRIAQYMKNQNKLKSEYKRCYTGPMHQVCGCKAEVHPRIQGYACGLLMLLKTINGSRFDSMEKKNLK